MKPWSASARAEFPASLIVLDTTSLTVVLLRHLLVISTQSRKPALTAVSACSSAGGTLHALVIAEAAARQLALSGSPKLSRRGSPVALLDVWPATDA